MFKTLLFVFITSIDLTGGRKCQSNVPLQASTVIRHHPPAIDTMEVVELIDSVISDRCSYFQIDPITLPDSLQQLMDVVSQSIQENKQWFVQYLKANNASSFHGLPYHENFSVSREAFERLITFSRARAQFSSNATQYAASVTKKEKIIIIEILSSNQLFRKLSIDFGTMKVCLDDRQLVLQNEFTPNDETAFGSVFGLSWKSQSPLQTITSPNSKGKYESIDLNIFVSNEKGLLFEIIKITPEKTQFSNISQWLCRLR